MKARSPAECRDNARVQTPCPDGRVAEIDDGVTAGVDARESGPDGNRLSRADLTGDHSHHPLVDAPGDPGRSFGVGAMGVQHGGSEVLGERHAGEAPVGPEAVDGHCWFSLYSSLVVLMVVSVG